jgi:glycosyltransferase involved in cell wall biosynthesis
MRVLLIDGATVYGEQSRHVVDLAMALQNRGHQVGCACETDATYRALRKEGIDVVRVGSGAGDGVTAVFELCRIIKGGDYDVVHTHGVHAGVAGRLAGRLARCRQLVHTTHTPTEGSYCSHPAVNSVISGALCRADGWMSRWSDMTIALSGNLRRRMVDCGVHRNRVVAIHSGVDLSAVPSPAEKRLARRKLMVPSGCKVVGAAAELTRRSNIPHLLHAARLVCKRFDDAIFVLVGDGEDMQKLRRMSQDLGVAHRVIFTGSRNDIRDILPGFDVFGVSSTRDSHMLAVVEAMAVGLPVVAPDVPGMSEAVVDGVTGHIVAFDDPAAFAAGICRVFEEGRADLMGEAGRDRAARLFGLDRMVEQIERVYLGRTEYRTAGTTANAVR